MKKTALIAVILVLGAASSFANLLQNGGFETAGASETEALYWRWANPDLNGSTWGTASRESWRAYAGTWEATIRGTWAGDVAGGWWQQASGEAGVTYTASAWFWADANWTAGQQGMKLEFYDAVSSVPLTVVTNLISGITENWEQKTIQAVAPENTAWVRVVVYADNVGGNGALQFDEVSVVAEPGTVIVISGVSWGLLLVASLFAISRRGNTHAA
ncbi:MAG: hypothetical protein PHP44_06660 [Kiritimatiellae bacterium]|nr:hypothetical protein [Kiritimatiellia bacterium]